MNDLVSIGMPVRNGEKFIERAINSLLNQTFENFELIISNNASEDSTIEIINKIAAIDSRIRIFNHEVIMPIGQNFEFVLKKSSGKYFMWAACDDVWGRNFIKYNRENLINNLYLVASISKCAEQNSEDKKVKMGDESIMYKSSLIRRFIYIINPGVNSRNYSLYKREILIKMPFNKYNFIAADWALAMDMLKYGSYYRDEREVGYYKNKYGESSKISEIRIEVTRNIIGHLLPLHSLTIYIMRYHGPLYLLQLIGLNFLYKCLIYPKLYNFVKLFKLKYPKFD